jgi:NTE family protein
MSFLTRALDPNNLRPSFDTLSVGSEKSLRGLVGDRRLGDTRIRFSMPAWNIDLNRVETFGTKATPDLPVAVAMRVAISIPLFVEPVRVNGHLYGDGGVVNIFPVRPAVEANPDLVVGLNCSRSAATARAA